MIKIDHLSYRYKNGRKIVLDSLTTTLKGGHVYGLLGKNGEGKSTLLKLLGGLLHANSGCIEVNGLNPVDRNVDFLADLFFLPEEFTLPSLTASRYEQLTAPFYPKFSTTLFHHALNEFDLNLSISINRYSLGQRKKFLIAFGLATNSGLMLLDEPTNGLDIPSKAKLRKLIGHSITADRLCIISTHQARDLASIIDAVVILNEGKLLLASSLSMIQQQFSMVKSDGKPSKKALYYEEDEEGFLSLQYKDGEEGGKFDLELFFSGLISNPSILDGDRGGEFFE